MEFPVIRLELNHMKQTLMVALSEYAMQLDTDIKAAVEAYCTPDNLRKVIQESIRQAMSGVLRDEARRFFEYGEGRKAIVDTIKACLSQREE